MRPFNNTILVRYANGLSVINISSIVRIQAVSNYSRLFLEDGRQIIVSKVLRQMEYILSGWKFTRVHRSHLINAARIRSYDAMQLKVKLDNNEEIKVSRRKLREIRKKYADKPEETGNPIQQAIMNRIRRQKVLVHQ